MKSDAYDLPKAKTIFFSDQRRMIFSSKELRLLVFCSQSVGVLEERVIAWWRYLMGLPNSTLTSFVRLRNSKSTLLTTEKKNSDHWPSIKTFSLLLPALSISPLGLVFRWEISVAACNYVAINSSTAKPAWSDRDDGRTLVKSLL